ncbi:nuclear transport factor 2 family protein [Aquincola sp. J276]|uniref:nuclear transport factor 2 family protein n=1 Tax=Aquincola sp. J276 TaxID=2898432 RepID=UPI002150A816|nr:nuclear transport factor 2 family protein [Aquincola sp. J276]MCR5864519.1 nuclear transport factor 2 family protein [Aquincola sp. J276]
MFKTFAFAATALTLAAGSAFAAPSDDARTHFQAIASGDTQIVMRAYADQAQLNWVGGPLDGTYATTDAIRGTWEKFGKAVGPLKLTIGSIEESANPKGSTVSANVVFEGKQPIKVRYVLTYREGKIVSETWQIDPKLNVAPAATAETAGKTATY